MSGHDTENHCGQLSHGFSAILSNFLFAISGAAAQGLEGYLGDWELNVSRFGAQFVLSFAILCIQKQCPTVDKDKIGWLLLVCISYCVNNYTVYAAAPLLPLALMEGLFLTLLMAMGALYELILKRTLSISNISAFLVCSIGVVLATQPGFLGFDHPVRKHLEGHTAICANHPTEAPNDSIPLENGHNLNELYNSSYYQSDSVFSKDATRGYIFTFVAACTCLVFLATINARLSDTSPVIVCFWTAIISLPISTIVMFMIEKPVLPTNAGCWGLLTAHSWALAMACHLNFYAAQDISALVLAIISNILFVLLAILQYTILKDIQPGPRNWMGVLGIVLMILGNILRPLLGWWINKRKGNKQTKEDDTFELVE